MNNEEKIEWQKGAYGCTEADLDTMVEHKIGGIDPMFIASILSDAQEVLSQGDAETSRQFMNRAKYFLFKLQEKIME